MGVRYGIGTPRNVGREDPERLFAHVTAGLRSGTSAMAAVLTSRIERVA